MSKILAESNIQIWQFEIYLWFLLPLALVCSLMFIAAMMSAEKFTPVSFLSLLFRPKLLTPKTRRYQIGLWISSTPLLILLAFFGIRMLDLPVNEVTNVIRSKSPDGSKTLTISQRERFPLDELFDPTISVRLSVTDNESAKVLAKRTLHLETSDLNEKPLVEWGTAAVKVRGFNYKKVEQTVTISF